MTTPAARAAGPLRATVPAPGRAVLAALVLLLIGPGACPARS